MGSLRACSSARARTARRRRHLHRQLDLALAERGQTIEGAIGAEGQHQAAEQAGMANLIGSLRLISTFDWSEFFESVSLVEQVLQRDPAGVYGRMDFRSRDRYRHAVEDLAAPTGEGPAAPRTEERRARPPGSRADPGCARGPHRVPPDWPRPAPVRAQRRLAAHPGPARQAPVLFPGDGRVSRQHRRRHAAADRHRRHLRLVARLERRVPAAGRSADRRSGQRADDPGAAAPDQPGDSTAAAAAARAHRGAGFGPDHGDRADAARQRRRRAAHGRASRSAGARQPRPARSFRHPQRFRGRLDRDAAARCRRAGGGAGGDCRTQRQARRRPVLPLPPPAPMERGRRPLDGMGAQARQDRGVQPPAARGHRHQLCGHGRRPGRAAAGPVLHHARQRHPPAERSGARSARHHHAPAQSRPVRSAASAGSPKGTASFSRGSASRS